MNNPELLPCPFCGGAARVESFGTDYIAECTLCNASCASGDTRERAAAVWNSRIDTVEKLAEPYNFSLLCDWYIHSATGKPVWTEAHIKELLHDFYLIPKGDLP